jgi:hypothetical protein
MNDEEKDQKPRTKYPVSDRVISGHRNQRSEVTSGKLWISSWSIGIWGDGESACVGVGFEGSGFCYDSGGRSPFMLVPTALVTTKKASVLLKTL